MVTDVATRLPSHISFEKCLWFRRWQLPEHVISGIWGDVWTIKWVCGGGKFRTIGVGVIFQFAFSDSVSPAYVESTASRAGRASRQSSCDLRLLL